MINISLIPTTPGIYFFLNDKKKIIYIGKAKNLRKRVKSYFLSKNHSTKTQIMIRNIQNIDYIVTENEFEALILENNLIKKNQPKYNIDLKDSKTYAYILMTKEKYPRLISVRNKSKPGTYFGPFTSAADRNRILNTVRDIFKLRTCRKIKKKPCLRHQINLCHAPCNARISEEEYLQNIQSAKRILKGKIRNVIQQLSGKMERYSKEQKYEVSLRLRDQINALQVLKKRQNIERDKKYNEDIINYLVEKDLVYLMLFNIDLGILKNKEEFTFDKHNGFFEEFILQYYSSKRVPKELIIPHYLDNNLAEFLRTKNRNVKITIPQKGEKNKLLLLVLKNIEHWVFPKKDSLIQLQKIIDLKNLPSHIECFDISHLMGKFTTASMVCYKNGFPYKNEYRRFKIKTVFQIDDPASIAEVVRRRYKRQIKEKNPLPDLIIIDGGKAQLNTALNEILKLKLRIPVISIAKQNEEIYTQDIKSPLRIDLKNRGLNLIREIRDEAHRFAIKYNRLLREKELLK